MWWIGIVVLIGLFFTFVRFTIVEEGTAKIIIRFGGVVKIFIQWTGYELSKKGNVEEVVSRPKKRLLGGLKVWIGLPVDKAYKFKLRWHSIELTAKGKEPVFHEELKDSVMLKDGVYWTKTSGLETEDGQYPDIEWGITLKVINPLKVIFKAPFNWVEKVLTLLQGLQREFGRQKTMEELMDIGKENKYRLLDNNDA